MQGWRDRNHCCQIHTEYFLIQTDLSLKCEEANPSHSHDERHAASILKLCGGGTTGAMARIGSECGVVWSVDDGNRQGSGKLVDAPGKRTSLHASTRQIAHTSTGDYSVLFSQGQGSTVAMYVYTLV